MIIIKYCNSSPLITDYLFPGGRYFEFVPGLAVIVVWEIVVGFDISKVQRSRGWFQERRGAFSRIVLYRNGHLCSYWSAMLRSDALSCFIVNSKEETCIIYIYVEIGPDGVACRVVFVERSAEMLPLYRTQIRGYTPTRIGGRMNSTHNSCLLIETLWHHTLLFGVIASCFRPFKMYNVQETGTSIVIRLIY